MIQKYDTMLIPFQHLYDTNNREGLFCGLSDYVIELCIGIATKESAKE